MLKKYFSLLLLSGLLAAACSPEKKPETTTAPPTAPDVAARPVAPMAAPAPMSPSAAPPVRTGRMHRQKAGRMANNPTELERYPAAPGPTTLADRPASASTMASDQAALRRFLQAGLPSAQEFLLRPGRDTLLIGRQGTQVLVPANAWPAGTGPVRLQLREFYQMADILLAGLHTRSGNQLLETGGMIHLAATAAGQPVELRPDAALSLYFPAKKVKADMQLFRGVRPEATDAVLMDAERIDWQPDTVSFSQKFSINLQSFDTTATGGILGDAKKRTEYWPTYAASRQQLKELAQIKYDAATVSRALRAPESAQEMATVYAYNAYVARAGRPQNTQRITELEFTVDTLGNATNARVRPGYNDELAGPVLAAIKSWRRWEPSRRPTAYGQEAVASVGVIRVLVTASGQARVSPVTWDHDALDIDGILAAKTAARKKAGLPSAEDLTQELRSTGLGWINCDRFYNVPKQLLFTYELNTNQLNSRATLVFKNMRSMLDGVAMAQPQRVAFANVPTGQEATIVAIYWQQGRAYLALHPTTLSTQNQHPKLDYRPVTLPELRQALAALE